MWFLLLIVAIAIILPRVAMSVDSKSEHANQNYNKLLDKKDRAEKVVQTTNSISFPEYNPEEYQRQKKKREDKALNGCQFFEAWNVDVFQENVEFLHNKQCPYCKCELPERKGKSYKCPNCKEKIYRLKDIATNFEGLFTEAQKEVRSKILAELSRRKNFLKVYTNACNYINFSFDNDKNLNIKRVLYLLHKAEPYIKSPKKVDQLRMCRFYEAEAQNLYGEPSEALNAWLSVAYIDFWGFYNQMYQYRKEYTTEEEESIVAMFKDKERLKKTMNKPMTDEELDKLINQVFDEEKHRKHYEEMRKTTQSPFNMCETIAPHVLKQILKLRPDIENLKDLFWFNAKEISKKVKYKPPIKIEEAWEKLLKQYHSEQNN